MVFDAGPCAFRLQGGGILGSVRGHMKIHRILAEASASILREVFRRRRVLDHELAAAFEANRKWGRRDRSFVAETVFEVARWRRLLAAIAGCEDIRALCAAQWVRMGLEVPAWWESGAATADEIRSRDAAAANLPFAVRESIPDWLDEVGRAELGARWEAEIAALNRRAPVFLRVNRLRTTVDEALQWLAEEGVAATRVGGLPDALVLPPGKELPKPLRHYGRVEIQDAGSQMISPMLGALPGERVIDACAGAGGKSLHLAALMAGQGIIHALDVDGRKLDELRRRARRARASIVRADPLGDQTVSGFSGKADRLLLDAPCSGLGTLKRQPDLKWRLRPAELERIREVQADLLDRYPAMLKPGGTLVYATCSILPSENRQAIQKRIGEGGFSLADELVISPAEFGFDGFYAARLVKDPE